MSPIFYSSHNTIAPVRLFGNIFLGYMAIDLSVIWHDIYPPMCTCQEKFVELVIFTIQSRAKIYNFRPTLVVLPINSML